MKIKEYLNDGANWQAQSVLAYFKSIIPCNSYVTNVEVTRYENCREQGYIFYLSKGGKQMNVAVYEHRNCDALCIVAFECSPHFPSREEVWEHMNDKWDVTKDFKEGEIKACTEAILDIFEEFESAFE